MTGLVQRKQCHNWANSLLLLLGLYLGLVLPISALEIAAELEWARRVELGTPVRGEFNA